MNNKNVVTIIILVVLAVLIGWYLSSRGILPGSKQSGDQQSSRTSEWQAVFLTNGQVYFGKLSDPSGRFVTLRDIYYLQLAQAPQPEGQNQNEQQQPQVSLVKLGNELHGPVDEMKINRDHILFIEDMKSDAKVVEAIDRYKREGPSAAQPAPTPATSASPQR